MDCWSAQVHSCFSYAQVIKAYQRLVHLRIKLTEPCKCWKLLISRMDGYSWIVSIYRFRSPYLSTIYKYISKYCGCFWGLPPSSLDHHDHHDHHDGFFSPFLFSGLRTCNWAIELTEWRMMRKVSHIPARQYSWSSSRYCVCSKLLRMISCVWGCTYKAQKNGWYLAVN